MGAGESLHPGLYARGSVEDSFGGARRSNRNIHPLGSRALAIYRDGHSCRAQQ